MTSTLEIWPFKNPWAIVWNLYEIVFRANITVRNFGQDTDFGYVYIVTLTIWPLINIMVARPLWNIITRFNTTIIITSYGLETDFGLWCIHCNIDLEILPCSNVMTLPWVMVNSCAKKHIHRIVVPQATWQQIWPWNWSKSRHGANWNGLLQGSCMPNINALSRSNKFDLEICQRSRSRSGAYQKSLSQ